MQKLHLVGVTPDRDGLILSVRRGASSGSYVLVLDDDLVAAVDEHRRRQADPGEAPIEGQPEPPRPQSTLSVREIQARLRRGRSVAEVASAAGVDAAWVERFAPPVLAERARVAASARARSLERPRLGLSALPLGDAIQRQLADRGLSMTPEEHAERWSAHLLDGGRWAVRFTYRYRGKDRVLGYELDEATGSIAALDRTSAQMGYLAPPGPGAARPRTGSEPARPAKARATGTTKRPSRPGPEARARSGGPAGQSDPPAAGADGARSPRRPSGRAPRKGPPGAP